MSIFSDEIRTNYLKGQIKVIKMWDSLQGTIGIISIHNRIKAKFLQKQCITKKNHEKTIT